MIDFIANNVISDAKSISKAIGLKPSRTRDYLKQFVDERFRDFVIASPKSGDANCVKFLESV